MIKTVNFNKNGESAMCLVSFGEFCEKEVVNCRDGKILGNPCDIKFDADSGMLVSFFVRESGRICFSRKPCGFEIYKDRIEKIGDDIILVNLEHVPIRSEREKRKNDREKTMP